MIKFRYFDIVADNATYTYDFNLRQYYIPQYGKWYSMTLEMFCYNLDKGVYVVVTDGK